MLLAACSLGGGTGSSTTGTTDAACAGGKPTTSTTGDLGSPITGTSSGQLPANQQVHLNIALNLNYQALDTCLNAIYDPSSPDYRHFLSPSDIASRFAPSAADVQTVEQYLTSNGLTISQSYATNAALTVDGTSAQVEKAFNLQLNQYQKSDPIHGSYTVYSPNQSPSLPQDVQNLIANISGLTSAAPASCSAGVCQYIQSADPPITIPAGVKVPAHPSNPSDGDCTLATIGIPGTNPGGASTLLTWDDTKAAYGLDTLANQGFDGGNTSIGLLEFDPYQRTDAVNYSICAGTYAQDRLQNIDVDPGLTPGAGAGEATLDVEMALGMTGKNTKVITYNAPNNAQWESEFQDILQKVASDKKVSVLSISYGDFETDLTPSYRAAVNDSMKLLASEGISTFVASGDCGAFGGGEYGAKVVDFPASAPWSITVGGTQLTTDPLTHARTTEQVWGNSSPDKTTCGNTWGSGGGLSVDPSFTIPSWQKGPGVSNQYSNGARQVPDVSASAINISIYYQGLWIGTGGTSAAAPIWATGVDVVDQYLAAKGKSPLGGVPVLYQLDSSHSDSINDITQGNNLFYSATKGWDFTSGLGSPNFDKIATDLASS